MKPGEGSVVGCGSWARSLDSSEGAPLAGVQDPDLGIVQSTQLVFRWLSRLQGWDKVKSTHGFQVASRCGV